MDEFIKRGYICKKRSLFLTRGTLLSMLSATTHRVILLKVDNELPAVAIRFGSNKTGHIKTYTTASVFVHAYVINIGSQVQKRPNICKFEISSYYHDVEAHLKSFNLICCKSRTEILLLSYEFLNE